MIENIRRNYKKITVVIILVVFTVYLTISGLVYFLSPGFVFEIDKSKNLTYDFQYETVFLKNTAGNKIEALFLKNPASKNIILFLHGSDGRKSVLLKQMMQYANVFSPAYPGYSLSEGYPSQDNLRETVDISMKYLLENGYTPSNIIVFGYSLGGYPAVYAAGAYPDLKEVVLVNTFNTFQEMCGYKYGIFCIFDYSFINSANIAKTAKAKIRQFHSSADQIIPFVEGAKLYANIGSSDKKFFSTAGEHKDVDISYILGVD
jgi:pimeloyl-ACP methyl ester carboxylesterase